MDFRALLFLWAGLASLRLAFLGLHLRDLDGLWRDYARLGPRFQLARGLDYLTLAVYLAAAMWALWHMDAQSPQRLARVFAAWLGVSLLERLSVHRFPRTNQPGGLDDARIALPVHVLMSILTALGATALSAVYFWWRG